MDSNIIEILKENELQFCKHWNVAIVKFEDKFITLYHKDFPDDYFFNRTIVNENLFLYLKDEDKIKNVFDSLFLFLNNLKIPLFLHISSSSLYSTYQDIMNKGMGSELKKNDEIFGLKYDNKYNSKTKNPNILRKFQIISKIEIVTDCNKLRDWIDTYCLSFDINLNKKNLIFDILKEKFNTFTFILSQLDIKYGYNNVYTGCCILYPYGNSLALYCLGTKKEYRNQNIATQMIEFSVKYGKLKGFKIFGLQTLKSDNLFSFYMKRGFVKIYDVSIFKYASS